MILRKQNIWKKSGTSQLWSIIYIAVFFKHQHPWKESIIILDFLPGDTHKGKIASEITISG